MDSAIFALAVESSEKADALGVSAEHVAHIKMFFSSTVKEAKRYLAADVRIEEAEENNAGDSASDDED